VEGVGGKIKSSQNGNFSVALKKKGDKLMRVIARKTLRDFWGEHADAEQQLKAWFHEAGAARWKSFADIKARYRSADVLPGNRVVFDIKGNNYRLVVKVHYNRSLVFIRFVGTHAEYDRINAETI
jgi:mRNA interferase HigB